MYPIKQSTAITVPVFMHDANGDAVTGLLDGGFTKRISKGSGAFAAMTVTITEMENGWYGVPLSTAHTDTLGLLTITLIHSSAKQANIQLRVTANLLDDVKADTAAILLDTGTDGVVVAAASKTGYALADATSDAVIADAVWNAATATYGSAGTYGLLIETDLDAAVSTRLATAGYTAPDNASIAAILVDTGTDGVVVAAGSKTGYALADSSSDAVIADAVWNAATATYGSAGSYGLLTETNLDAAVSTRLATAGYTAPDNASIAAILADTGTDGVVVAAASKTGYALADSTSDAVIADAVWNAATATYGSAGTYGLVVETAGTEVTAVLADTGTDGVVVAAGSKTGYTITSAEHTNIADATLKRDMSAVTGEAARSPLNALRLLRNKWSVAAGTLTVTKEDDSTSAWTAAVTADAAANPITASDPA